MKINLSNIKKRLPWPIKKYLGPIYHKWDIKIDKEIIIFLKNYYNLSEKEVLRLLRSGGQLSADFWFCSNPRTGLETVKFYEDNPFYAFNLIFWHGTRYQRNLRDRFIKLAKGKVLDYGGGVGDLCLKIRKNGLSVDYADLQGKMFDFASKFFKENNLYINMINLSKNKISGKYDTIFCVDVIEHVVNPKDTLKELVSHLNTNGQLIITALESNISNEAPMHFEIKFNPEEYLNLLGIKKLKEPFLWIKI